MGADLMGTAGQKGYPQTGIIAAAPEREVFGSDRLAVRHLVSGNRNQVGLRIFFQKAFDFLRLCYPVSYTHLDVYKRQTLWVRVP